jgi:hypothetical protein
VECTPPAIAKILAIAVKVGDHKVDSVANCLGGFPNRKLNLVGNLQRTSRSSPSTNHRGDTIKITESIETLLSAIHSFGVATNALQEEAIEKLQELRYKSKQSTKKAKSTPDRSAHAVHASNESVESQEINQGNDSLSGDHLNPKYTQAKPTATDELQGVHTPQQQADAHRKTMIDEGSWKPDYSDCKVPSAAEIQQLLELSEIKDNMNLGDQKDNVIYWFANHLLTDNWPLVDGVLRQAGPTQMRIEHTQIVNKPGYRINHPEKLVAIQYIIKDLLEKILSPRQNPRTVVLH